ncbi:hypothetical protein HZB02_07620 [Candidatus Woesearchaeota archaeon]|nr:hypothetical protein [Candidatus Woesearchaeota archaeon]
MVSPSYLSRQLQQQMRAAFLQNKELPSIQLQQIFPATLAPKLAAQLASLSFAQNKDPLHHSYREAALPPTLQQQLFSSEMISLLNAIVGTQAVIKDPKVLLFSWKDYTLLHDEHIPKPGIDVILDFTIDLPQHAGGSLVYVDGTGEYTKLSPSFNTLIVVQRKKGVQSFLQYLNHYSKGKKRLFGICTT